MYGMKPPKKTITASGAASGTPRTYRKTKLVRALIAASTDVPRR